MYASGIGMLTSVAQPKQIVIRLIEEVMNGGDLDLIERCSHRR